jgi:UDP-GlcNAc:undecaprenyl-phosphate GlcNAc-1-phosphate transferase
MLTPILGLMTCACIVSFLATAVLVRLGARAGALDGRGVDGQIKAAPRRVPNIGGIGVVIGLAGTMAAAFAAVSLGLVPESIVSKDLAAGVKGESIAAAIALAGLLGVHVLGLVDDRRPLPWAPKLLIMLALPAAVAWLTGTRVLTAADTYVGGAWLSVGLTALWFAAVMNAMNFMDNMDGLAGGTACVIAAAITGVAFQQQQWLVAGAAACLVGATLGFLPHNFPRARIFMGDGGSLVLGFALAFLTTRLTYVETSAPEPRWDRMVIPIVLLSVPLYDMLSVIVIRVSQGRSPFVGDLQHLSHRFEGRGLSRPRVALAVWTLAMIAGFGAVIATSGTPTQSLLVGAQTLAALALLAMVERGMPWREA